MLIDSLLIDVEWNNFYRFLSKQLDIFFMLTALTCGSWMSPIYYLLQVVGFSLWALLELSVDFKSALVCLRDQAMHADSSDIQLTYELNKTPVCFVQVITEIEEGKTDACCNQWKNRMRIKLCRMKTHCCGCKPRL